MRTQALTLLVLLSFTVVLSAKKIPVGLKQELADQYVGWWDDLQYCFFANPSNQVQCVNDTIYHYVQNNTRVVQFTAGVDGDRSTLLDEFLFFATGHVTWLNYAINPPVVCQYNETDYFVTGSNWLAATTDVYNTGCVPNATQNCLLNYLVMGYNYFAYRVHDKGVDEDGEKDYNIKLNLLSFGGGFWSQQPGPCAHHSACATVFTNPSLGVWQNPAGIGWAPGPLFQIRGPHGCKFTDIDGFPQFSSYV